MTARLTEGRQNSLAVQIRAILADIQVELADCTLAHERPTVRLKLDLSNVSACMQLAVRELDNSPISISRLEELLVCASRRKSPFEPTKVRMFRSLC